MWLSRRQSIHAITRPIVPPLLAADDPPPPPPPPPPSSSTPAPTPESFSSALSQPDRPWSQASSPFPLPSSAPRILPDQLILYNSPATYPRLTRLSDGSILLSFTRTPSPVRILTVHRSLDNGTTFHPWSVIWHSSNDIGNLFLLEVPVAEPGFSDSASDADADPPPLHTGPRVLAAFRNHDVAKADARRRTFFRITLCESDDGGHTWHFVTQVAEKAAPWGLWEPFLRLGSGAGDRTAPGHVQMTYSRELAAKDQDTILHESLGGGRTWSAGQTVTGGGGAEETMLRDGMTGIAATLDVGTVRAGESMQAKAALVMVFETTRYARTFSLEAVVSYDDGQTWGHRQPVYEPAALPPPGQTLDTAGAGTGSTGKRGNAGAPQIESFAHGGLAVVFMTDEDVPETERRWPFQAAVKTLFGGPLVDGQIQWLENQPPLETCPRQSLWPGIFRRDEYQLLVACEHGERILGRLLEWAPP
ncbi:Sialidase [Coniella lustricola]|uniref:Sialidase n=1 Tax=Coniella lustricola TaxID=2025994 RepID=A0A2T3A683_9PEZI|nr:Sialidase [Coniella lustricola]